MKNGIWSGIGLYIFCFIIFIAAVPMRICAKEESGDKIYVAAGNDIITGVDIINSSDTITGVDTTNEVDTIKGVDTTAGTNADDEIQTGAAAEDETDTEDRDETVNMPPHLIQTVTEKDIFESMLELGFLESKVLEKADCEKAYENVKACIVNVSMGNAHGSGVVWDITPEQTIIATNRHVLEYWNSVVSYVHFPQGYYLDAKVLAASKNHDVGFLAIDNDEFEYRELENLRFVCKDIDVFEEMQIGDEIFCLGAQSSKEINDNTINEGVQSADNFYIGSIGDMNRYIDEFGEYMIYGLGYAKPGMSGGGTFDAKGNFIGMISGGTAGAETASVPLPVIIEEYDKIK